MPEYERKEGTYHGTSSNNREWIQHSFYSSDASGSFLLIAIPPSAGKDIANLAGAMLNGHLIKMVDFAKNNDVRFIKAYY